jgi:gluconolactonase
MIGRDVIAVLGLVTLAGMAVDATPSAVRGLLDGKPGAVIDLDTADGLRVVNGEWTYSESPVLTSARWQPLPAASLQTRRTQGGASTAWYRLSFVVPARVASFDTGGSTIVFEVVVDDYAEVWVNGTLARGLGQAGGSLVAGFNVPNRVVLTRDALPGDYMEIAVFAANGPLSDPPANKVWIRSATLDFFRETVTAGDAADVLRLDPAIDRVVPRDVRIEQLASGFSFTEGPVWTPEGLLLFSDPDDNRIYRWSADLGVSVFRTKSGYSGTDIGEYRQPGSNGLTLDAHGRLTIAEHGNRRITRLEKNGDITVLADRFDGRRLNSPNDLVYRSDGSLYFTDPFFGLPKLEQDRRREQPHAGIYRVQNGHVQLLSTDLKGPNGIAFSPDERYLYVANWDEHKKVVMRWEVRHDGSLADGRVFFDMTAAPGQEALDGLKVDREGHVYVSGPGGVWILSPEGTHVGTLRVPELPANFTWGDADGRTLYLTARSGIYRIRMRIPGVRPMMPKETN